MNNKRPKDFLKDIISHAEKDYPLEACGLICVDKNHNSFAISCDNKSENPSQSFLIHPDNIAEVSQKYKIVATYHSHCYTDETPSQADIRCSEKLNLPCYIYSNVSKKINIYKPNGNYVPPLIGRPFVWGILDCWCLVVDYHFINNNIVVPNHYYRDSWETLIRENLFEKNIDILIAENKKTNRKYKFKTFYCLDEMELGDTICFKISSDKIDHVGIYLGDNSLLHHFYGLSKEVYFGSFWKNRTFCFKRLCEITE